MVWTILRSLFPFLKETIIGKGSFAQALKYDRRRLYVFVMVVTSLFLNMIIVPDYVKLKFNKQEIDVQALIDVNKRLQVRIGSLEQELAYCHLQSGSDILDPPITEDKLLPNTYDRHDFFFNELNHLAGPTHYSSY